MYSRLTKDVVLHCTDARFFVGRRFLKNAALLCLIISATGRSSILCINPFAFDSVQSRVADYLTCPCSILAVTWIFHYCSLKMPQHFYSFQATTSAARPFSSVLICPILWKVSWKHLMEEEYPHMAGSSPPPRPAKRLRGANLLRSRTKICNGLVLSSRHVCCNVCLVS